VSLVGEDNARIKSGAGDRFTRILKKPSINGYSSHSTNPNNFNKNGSEQQRSEPNYSSSVVKNGTNGRNLIPLDDEDFGDF